MSFVITVEVYEYLLAWERDFNFNLVWGILILFKGLWIITWDYFVYVCVWNGLNVMYIIEYWFYYYVGFNIGLTLTDYYFYSLKFVSLTVDYIYFV